MPFLGFFSGLYVVQTFLFFNIILLLLLKKKKKNGSRFQKKKKQERKRQMKNGTWTIIQCQTIQMSSQI